MSLLLDFFTAGPARVKGLLVALLAAVALGLALTTWALVERLGAVQARAERDRALDQVAVVSAAAKACSASVDQTKRVADAAVKAGAAAVAAAKRANAPLAAEVARLSAVVAGTSRPTPEQAQDCAWGWDLIEQQHRKAGGP